MQFLHNKDIEKCIILAKIFRKKKKNFLKKHLSLL